MAWRLFDDLDLPMIVAMTIVGMVQMPIDQVIHVVAMRNRRMATTWAMHMVCAVARAGMPTGASGGILARYLQDMLFHLPIGRGVVQVSIVEIVNMAVVLDGRMTAIFAVGMVVFVVMMGHSVNPLEFLGVV